jgi:hypothetical protein
MKLPKQVAPVAAAVAACAATCALGPEDCLPCFASLGASSCIDCL